jgi:hypothetical protein
VASVSAHIHVSQAKNPQVTATRDPKIRDREPTQAPMVTLGLGAALTNPLRDRAADDEGEPVLILTLNDDAGVVADALVALPGTAPISALTEAAWTVAGVTGWNSVLRCG